MRTISSRPGGGSVVGGVCLGGVHLPLWTESQTGVKHYLSTTLFADGNKKASQ